MQKSLTLLSAHLGVCIAKHETDRGEEVTLAGTVAADYNIVLWGERFDDRLVLVAVETPVKILLC